MRHLNLIPELTGLPHTVGELRDAGVPRWRLYARDVAHPIHGVVARGDDHTMGDRQVQALRLKMREGQFFSRRTAAGLLGLPVSGSGGRHLIEVGAVRPIRPPRRPQVEGHQLRPGALLQVPKGPAWLPVVEDAWCLLAQVSSKVELLAAADFIVSGPSRYDEPLATLDQLAAASRRFAGCTGAILREQVLPLVRTGVESPAESELRLLLVEAGFEEPETHCPVWVGTRTLHADLGYRRLKIAIEYEGAYHFGVDAVEQGRRDVARVRAMEAAGWQVIRVTVHDLRDPRALCADLTEALLRAKREAV